MSEIKNFQPAGIWQNFYLLTQVPRPSGHLDKVRAFLLDWAAQKGIDAHADEAGNVLMYKAATPGMENCKMVTLQGHMDMVPQKTADSNHDFENDPSRPGWTATGYAPRTPPSAPTTAWP